MECKDVLYIYTSTNIPKLSNVNKPCKEKNIFTEHEVKYPNQMVVLEFENLDDLSDVFEDLKFKVIIP